MEFEEISDLMRENLRTWPIFGEEHSIEVRNLDKGKLLGERKLWVGYRTTSGNPIGTTHFDLNIIGDICYILSVYLVPASRGKGLYKELLKVVEDFARECGCGRVRLNPSGWTPSGKTRLEYMGALGYHKVGREVEKILN